MKEMEEEKAQKRRDLNELMGVLASMTGQSQANVSAASAAAPAQAGQPADKKKVTFDASVDSQQAEASAVKLQALLDKMTVSGKANGKQG